MWIVYPYSVETATQALTLTTDGIRFEGVFNPRYLAPSGIEVWVRVGKPENPYEIIGKPESTPAAAPSVAIFGGNRGEILRTYKSSDGVFPTSSGLIDFELRLYQNGFSMVEASSGENLEVIGCGNTQSNVVVTHVINAACTTVVSPSQSSDPNYGVGLVVLISNFHEIGGKTQPLNGSAVITITGPKDSEISAAYFMLFEFVSGDAIRYLTYWLGRCLRDNRQNTHQFSVAFGSTSTANIPPELITLLPYSSEPLKQIVQATIDANHYVVR